MTFSLIFLYRVKYSLAVPQGEKGCHFLSVCIIVLCTMKLYLRGRVLNFIFTQGCDEMD